MSEFLKNNARNNLKNFPMMIGLVDPLIEGIVRLYKYRKTTKKKMFDDYITPIYTEFQKLHEDYIKSFEEYRKLIQSSNQLNRDNKLLDRVQKDNLFKAHYRIKVFQLAKIAKDELIGPFVYSIYSYLIDPLIIDKDEKELFNEEEGIPEEWKSAELQDLDILNTQFFRSSLYSILDTIAKEMWTSVFDPNASRPPLSESEITHEQKLCFIKFNIAQNDPQKIEKLKIALAIQELDVLVNIMQSAYQNVFIEFNNLKKKLYLKKKSKKLFSKVF